MVEENSEEQAGTEVVEDGGARKNGRILAPIAAGRIILSREQFLNVDDLEYEDVLLPELAKPLGLPEGTEVCLRMRSLTGEERNAFEQAVMIQKGKDREVNFRMFREKLVARSAVDENNARMFNDSEIELLGRKNSAIIEKLFKVAQRLSGMSQEDVEEMTKNSESDQSDSSTSG